VPLADTDILQTASGGFTGTSGNATLGVGTTAGSTVVLVATIGSPANVAPPSGFTDRGGTPVTAVARPYVFTKSGVGAGETSYTLAPNASTPVAWTLLEVQGLDPDAPVDVSVLQTGASSGTTVSTGTTPQSTTYDGMALAVLAHGNASGTTAPTFSGHSAGYTEVAQQGQAGTSNAVAHSVATQFAQQLGTWSCSATSSLTGAAGNVLVGSLLLLSAEGAKRAADVRDLWGMEWLTAAGLGTGNVGNRIFETVTGNPTIGNDPANARTGSGYLELPATATIDNAQGISQTIAVGTEGAIARVCFRFVGSLPTADVEVFSLLNAAAVMRYRAASGKLSLQLSTSTEQLSDQAVTADQWIAVDVRVMDIGAEWAGDWTVTYDATPGASSIPVPQTRALHTTATGLGSFIPVLGRTVAPSSAPPLIRYDDVVVSRIRGHHPLGDHRIYGIGPDPAGTLTISGTATNFQTFSANGTMAAWNAATALAAIDEVPPTVGATADGIAQVTAATADYVSIPLETVQAAPDGSIRAVKLYFCGWAASATAATVGFRAHDGTTSHTLFAAADPAFDNSSTPAWVCKVVRTTGGGKIDWTQPKLDELAARMGFSDDATPDIGVHAVRGEVAKQMAQTQTLFGTLATQALDPLSGGILGVTVTTPPDRAADLYYEVDGTPTTVPIAADDTYTEMIGAPDEPTVNYLALYFDPEP
jgi:hypothetical protein